MTAGSTKLIYFEETYSWFEAYGYPGAFTFVVGSIEVLAAIGLLFKASRFISLSIFAGFNVWCCWYPFGLW